MGAQGESEPMEEAREERAGICMIVFNNLDPDPRVWKEATTLAKAGYAVTIVALRGRDQERQRREGGVLVWRMLDHFPYGPNLWKVIPEWIRIFRFIFKKKRKRFRVYHCHDPETLPVGYLLARRDKAQLIYDVHEVLRSYIPLGHRPLRSRVLLAGYRCVMGWFEGRLIRKAQSVITVSRSIAQFLKKYYRLKRLPVTVRNTRYYVDISKNDFIRLRFGWGQDRKILFYQGVIRPDRELERILQALPRMKQNIVFVMAGAVSPEGYLDQLRSEARELGVEDRFHHIGNLKYDDELLMATASADIGVFWLPGSNLTYRFSLGNKIFDFIMADLPMITSDLPEMRRLIEQYRIGFCVPIDNQDLFVKKVHELVSDPSLYKTLVGNIRRIKRDLSWENEAKNLLDVYEALLRV